MIVGSAIIMQQINSTVITTALPQMAISLHTDPVRLSVAVTAYLLSLAVFVPVSGWAADRFGGRTIFRAAIALFTLGSILCGLSGNIVELTAARVLQGLGGAMMVPVGRLVLFRSVEKTALIATMAYLQVPAQLGPVLGPPIGGFITTYFSWRWIFLVNVPLGILGIVLVTIFFDNPKEETHRPFDWIGFVLTGAALFCLMYCDRGVRPRPRRSNGSRGIAGDGCRGRHAGASASVAFASIRCSIFRYSASPLFKPASPAARCFAPAPALWFFCCRCCCKSCSACRPSPRAPSHSPPPRLDVDEDDGAADPRRFGFRKVIIVNCLISAVSVAMCMLFSPATPVVVIFGLLLIAGFFQSLQFTATQAMTYADVDQPQHELGDQHRQHVAAIEPRLRYCLRRGFVESVDGLARRRVRSAGPISRSPSPARRFWCCSTCRSGWILRHDAASEVSGHRPKIES